MFRPPEAMTSALNIRPAIAADWHAIEALHAHRARVNRSPQAWHWRYGDGSQPAPERLGVVAWADDTQLMAFASGRFYPAWAQGVQQLTFVLHDRIVRVSAPGAAATASDNLLDACDAALRKLSHLQVALCVSFVAEPVPPSNERVGSNSELVWCECTIAAQAELPGCTCLVLPTQFMEPGWDALWVARSKTVSASMVRDQRYLAWRFGRCPVEGGPSGGGYWSFAFWSISSANPLGYVVLRPGVAGVATMVDAVWPQQTQALRDGMRQVAAFLTERGITTIRTAMTTASPEFAYLGSLGFTPLRTKSSERIFVRLLDGGGTQAAQWSVSLADSLLY